MLKRAYSLFEVKSFDDDKREIEGIATTPTPDRMGDIVEPKGAEFKLPLPLLWQHNSAQPIGSVTHAKVTNDGITIKARLAKIDEPGTLKDRLDEAWQSLKHGLVRGLSIGFAPLESAQIKDTFSFRFTSWEWLELSAVTIPANSEASISIVKSIDTEQRAASGPRAGGFVRLIQSPGVSGNKSPAKSGSVKLIPRNYT
jgi:HK97 family phage prohead protease